MDINNERRKLEYLDEILEMIWGMRRRIVVSKELLSNYGSMGFFDLKYSWEKTLETRLKAEARLLSYYNKKKKEL